MALTIIKSVMTPTAGWYPGSRGGLYDLVDLPTVKSVLDITDGGSDAKLQLFITQASSAVRQYCNRTFQAQRYQELIWPRRDPYPWQLPAHMQPLQLQEWPLSGSPCTAGTAAPAAAGALSTVAAGALQAQNYFVTVTYQTPTGESPVSAETNLVVGAGSVLQVGAPPADPNAAATGWNVYVGAQGAETRQNGAPIALNAAWTMPATGLQPGAAMPTYPSVIINANVNATAINGVPQSLVEGRDFIADYKRGQLTRLFTDGYPKSWEMLPTSAVYSAGYPQLTSDVSAVQDACIRLVRGAYFGAKRDPNLRSENIEGVSSMQYWFANGPGGSGFPPDVQALLDDWRVPVIG